MYTIDKFLARTTCLLVIICNLGPGSILGSGQNDVRPPAVGHLYSRLPLSFEPNEGQANPQVKFLSSTGNYRFFFTTSEVILAPRQLAMSKAGLIVGLGTGKPIPLADRAQNGQRTPSLRIKFVGEKRGVRVSGIDPLPGRINYFVGNDPKKWRCNLSTYSRVKYEELYPGIDLIFYCNHQGLEYDIVVKAGANPRKIRLAFSGSGPLRLDSQGNLIASLGAVKVIQHFPMVYQESGGLRQAIPAGYVLLDDQHVGFRIGDYDTTQPLVIDPVLSYSSYLGGTGSDQGNAIAVDRAGNIYIVGITLSTDFPTSNPLQASLRTSQTVFVTKLNPNGSQLVYSTYLGGSTGENGDRGRGIAVDASGNAYVTGETSSRDFPTVNAIQGNNRGGLFGFDAFVTKLNASGSAIVYSTYLGGAKDDRANGIAVDGFGNVSIVGETTSPDFPTLNAFQPTYGGSAFISPGGTEFGDAFVARIGASGSVLIYSSFLGGKDADQGFAIAVDSASNAYLTGRTFSTDFPLMRPFQIPMGGGFVSKVSSTGALVYSTHFNGEGHGIAVDASGNAYVVGSTSSHDFPVVNPIQRTLSGSVGQTPVDAFITKFAGDGSALVYSTYLGGDGGDVASGVAVDNSSNAYVAGSTRSTDFPMASAFQARGGGGDGFVVKISAAGSRLIYSSYVGGKGDDRINGIAVDASGNAFVVGETTSTDFPMVAPIQKTLRGGFDVFIAKISDATKLFFAQFGDGAQGGTSIFSQITLFNLDPARSANTSIEINDDSGNPISVDLNGTVINGRKDVIIPPDGAVILRSGGTGPIQAGSVVMTSDRNISGVILFGGSIGTAGVGDSKPLRKFVAPVETQTGVNTGLALMGLGQQQTIQLELRDQQGAVLARASFVLGARSHTAKFVTELLWDTPPDFSNFSGTLKATGTSELAATVIRVSPGEFATLPVTEIQ